MRKRVYHFSLHTVFDAPMVDVQFLNEEQTVRSIQRITCFSKYMVRKVDTSASVHFLNISSVDSWITDLADLHHYNRSFFTGEIAKSYSAITTSEEVRKYFESNLSVLLKYYIQDSMMRNRIREPLESISLEMNDKVLEIHVDIKGDVEILNSDGKLREKINALLFRRARYAGPFSITETDIPF
ncbi:hypothetical protein ABB28_08975 [Stenotrophomonas chelatiphaga]|uniref:Uncharacterized protein n=1 Tax=Stenotrophomonas chelatiphaga TaxID=517011 RepID=A0A0R0CVR0_9GAMM|nr:hypothetical protein ABB28_08975 [Stenotrophomonas chelatiphaga]